MIKNSKVQIKHANLEQAKEAFNLQEMIFQDQALTTVSTKKTKLETWEDTQEKEHSTEAKKYFMETNNYKETFKVQNTWFKNATLINKFIWIFLIKFLR